MDRATPAMLATGSRKLIGPALILCTFFFPIIFFVPLLNTRLLLVKYNELTLIRVAHDLFFMDKFLFVVVFGFGMLLPVCKMFASIICWYQLPVKETSRWSSMLGLLSKLSMLDIMLVAVFIVGFKGTGFGTVEIRYGLYVYTMFIVGSFAINLAMEHFSRAAISRGA